jgi:hypothetical protein
MLTDGLSGRGVELTPINFPSEYRILRRLACLSSP